MPIIETPVPVDVGRVAGGVAECVAGGFEV